LENTKENFSNLFNNDNFNPKLIWNKDMRKFFFSIINNQITDFSFIQDLKGLTSLFLSSNQITDISFLIIILLPSLIK
jgi:Leucine-rich repeat (LRR) protein